MMNQLANVLSAKKTRISAAQVECYDAKILNNLIWLYTLNSIEIQKC